MQNRVPCLLEDRLCIERNGQEIVCPCVNAMVSHSGRLSRNPLTVMARLPPSRCYAPLHACRARIVALFPVLAHVAPAIFLHGGGEKRRIVIRRIEADELGFELPLQYLDQLASKIAV
jgi:hypothetical protein